MFSSFNFKQALITRLLITAPIALALTLTVNSVSAQNLKIGFIDDEKVLQNYEAWKKAGEQFQTEMQAWEEEANQMMQNYVQDSLEFEKQKLILSSERKAERQAEIAAKRTAVEAFTRDVFGQSGQAERKNTSLTKPLIDNMLAAIQKVAADGNYDIIFNASALAYINPAFDITDKVTEALGEDG